MAKDLLFTNTVNDEAKELESLRALGYFLELWLVTKIFNLKIELFYQSILGESISDY